MLPRAIVVATCGLALALAAPAAQAQVGGNLAAGPPLDIHLEIATGQDGPLLSTTEFDLVTGEYYRLNVTSDGAEPWRLEVDDLLRNSHLRIVTINGIEVHLQALAFRAIEFDSRSAVSVSAHIGCRRARENRAAGRMTSEAGCRPVPARHKCDFGGVAAMTP